MELKYVDLKYLKHKIEKCIDKFYLNELDLLKRENYEVTISSKLAQYLFVEFPKFHVDCEYNKHLNGKKEIYINKEKQEIRPDIVIHERGIDEDNSVYIEIKTDHNPDPRDNDFSKIKAVTKQGGEYEYLLGVFIEFTKDKKDLIIKYFRDGEEWN